MTKYLYKIIKMKKIICKIKGIISNIMQLIDFVKRWIKMNVAYSVIR